MSGAAPRLTTYFRLERRLVDDTRHKVELEKAAVERDLKEKLTELTKKIDQLEVQLEQRQTATIESDRMLIARLLRQIAELKADQSITESVLVDVDVEFQKSKKNLAVQLPQVPSVQLATLLARVDRANYHLKSLGKEHLVRFLHFFE